MYLVVGRCRRSGFVECNRNSIFWYLRKSLGGTEKKSPEVISELVPMGIREIIPEKSKGKIVLRGAGGIDNGRNI